MKIVIPALVCLAFLGGCGDELISEESAGELQKPIELTVANDNKSRSLTNSYFTISAVEPGESYKQSLVVKNSGGKKIHLLLAVKTPLWLDSSGYQKIWLDGKKSKTVTFYFVGDEESRGKEGRIEFTVGTL